MMLIIYHNGSQVVEVNNANSPIAVKLNTLTIAEFLVELAKEYPDTILVWCHVRLKAQLNISEIEMLFHHRKLLFSYNSSDGSFIDKAIGYVEESPFVRVNKNVTFATWQMSSDIGAIHSELVLALKNEIPFGKNFDYFLCSLAKLGMRKGLLCYSEPRLLMQQSDRVLTISNKYTLFRFVKQHYKTRWIFLLLLNLGMYERKFPIVPFLCSLFYKNINNNNLNLKDISVKSFRKEVSKATVDVIIPTIGRKKYLYEMLKDLKVQTKLPTNVIIVEQNPNKGSESELDYLTNEIWPFRVKHTLTQQTGACNARNVALAQVTSEWVFFADDDIRVEVDFIEKTLEQVEDFGTKAVTLRCYQKGENRMDASVFQWGTFGGGCSFVFADSLKSCKFNMGYEFGFGEDGDFGMQLRNQGVDVLHLPQPEILHLKAPSGGFRTKPELQWQNEIIQPKPSPAIMLFQISHNTKEQILGYKTILFIKYYKLQKIKNPICYYFNFQKQWDVSLNWANELKKENEI